MGAPSTGGTAKNPKTPETLENPEHPERTKPLPGAGEVVPSGTDTSAAEPDGNTPETDASLDTDGTETPDNTPKSANPQLTDPQPADSPSEEPQSAQLQPDTDQAMAETTRPLPDTAAPEPDSSDTTAALDTPDEEEPTVALDEEAAFSHTKTLGHAVAGRYVSEDDLDGMGIPAEHPMRAPSVLLAPPAQPFAAGLRRTLAILLAALALITAVLGAGGKWAGTHLISTRGFNDLSSRLADDQDLQKRVAQAAVTDLMNSEGLKKYLDPNGSSWVNRLLVHNRDSVQKTLTESAEKISTTGEYKKLWRQVTTDTHAHLISDENTPAALDSSAFYRELDTAVGTFGIYDPDIPSWGNRYITLEDGSSTAVHGKIMQLKSFADSADTFLTVSLMSMLIALLLWPRGRPLFLACVLIAATLAAWGASFYLEGVTPASLGMNPGSELGKVFLDGLFNGARPDAVASARATASYSLIATLITLLLGILVKLTRLTRLTASTTTVPTH